MKNFFFITILFMFLAGCTNPINNDSEKSGSAAILTKDGVRYVKNSIWESCSLSYLTAKTASRAVEAEISCEELEAIVDTINEETNDDQLVLLTEDVPIEESPLVNVYIVNEGDYAILEEWIGLERVDFAARRKDFELGAAGLGGILFVDKVPPAPIIPPDTRTREEKYALYMVNKYDDIVVYNGYKYEQHIDQIWDSLTDDVKAGYKNDIDKLMGARVAGFEAEIRGVGLVPSDAPWRVVYGQIYVKPPVEPEPTDPPAEE